MKQQMILISPSDNYMKDRELYLAITDFNDKDGSFKSWRLGEYGLGAITVQLEYNLTFQCLDIYLDDGRVIKNFNVKELHYRPRDAKEESLSAHERAITEVKVSQHN